MDGWSKKKIEKKLIREKNIRVIDIWKLLKQNYVKSKRLQDG